MHGLSQARSIYLSAGLVALLVLPAAAQEPLPLPATEEIRTLHDRFFAMGGGADLAVNPANPQELYWAVSDIGVLRSADGGATWHPVNHGLPNHC